MKKLAVFSICLYFAVCPLEYIFNAFVGRSATYAAIFTVGCIALYYLCTPDAKFKFGRNQILILIWLIFECTSVLWTIPHSLTYTRTETYILNAALVLLFSGFEFDEKEFDLVLKFYAYSGLLLAVILLAFGKMDGGFNYDSRMTIYIPGGSKKGYQDPNSLAALILSASFYFFNKVFNKNKLSVLYLALFGVDCVAILYTGSRGALISLFAVLLIFVSSKIEKKKRVPFFILFVGIFILIFFLLKTFLSEPLYNRLFDIDTYAGGTGRTKIWGNLLPSMLEHPLFGRGIVSFLGYSFDIYGKAGAVHNSYISVIFEVGLVGFSLFIIPFISSLRKSFKNRNILIFVLILSAMFPAFFLDTLYLRFLWNALSIGLIYCNSNLGSLDNLKKDDENGQRSNQAAPDRTA